MKILDTRLNVMDHVTMELQRNIARATDISHVAFIDRDTVRGAAWEGTDGWDYSARIFEGETGPFLRVQCFDQDTAQVEVEWRLAANTDLLRLLANGLVGAPVHAMRDDHDEVDA